MRIDDKKLDEMFNLSGISKEDLYGALKIMGPQYLKTKEMRDKWTPEIPTYCYCYRVAEYLYYWKAPKGSKPYKLRVPGDPGTHRFIKWNDRDIIDLTVDQFPNFEDVDYSKAKVCYFMQSAHPGPSNTTRILASLMGEKNYDEIKRRIS